MERRILVANPHGFCKGVGKAVAMLRNTLEQEGKSGKIVYVRKEIVHNTALVEDFEAKGAVIVNEVDDVPEGGIVVFSAHGVAPIVREKALARNLCVVDTTCDLVTKVHEAAIRYASEGYTIILIGEPGHKEMVGVIGEAPDNIRFIHNELDIDSLSDMDITRLVWLSQTTLNVDETQKIVECLRKKFPTLEDPSDDCICYATKNHQLAVKNIAGGCDLFVVVGSQTSSNTKRLVEVAMESGAKRAIRIDEPDELKDIDFSAIYTVGITSGVSVTEEQLARTRVYLENMGYICPEEHIVPKKN